jgi:hypothetical protein
VRWCVRSWRLSGTARHQRCNILAVIVLGPCK